ncbi:MAG: hypothetical protein LAD29_03760 [Rhodoferax sp.]|jgi:hypothetical protein|nr:hypothetical protein [Rhodoferax sp.]
MKAPNPIIRLLAFSVMAPLFTGCASIVSGQNQSLSVETLHAGKPLSGASCKLDNDKGSWFVTTPGSVTVRRSGDALNLRCEKEGMEPGVAAVQSATKGMAFGNILFGGFIGGAVDISSGAAYDYPVLITVPMGSAAPLANVVPPQTNTATK